MIYLKASSGLGDALYLRAVALHLLKRGEEVMVFTRWPDAFSGLNLALKTLADVSPPHLRSVSYPTGTPLPMGFTEFQARCQTAGIEESVELRIDWRVTDETLLDEIKSAAAGRKIFIYQLPKTVRADVEASALLRPRRAAFLRVIERHSHYFRIKLGHPPWVDEDREMPCELDFFGKGHIKKTFDVCTLGDLFFSQPCFITVMAEALERRHICMFARAALGSNVPRANTTTPERVFSKKHLATAVYDD